MPRIFIAVDISDEARDAAAAHIRSLTAEPNSRGLRGVRPENLHLTLKFLGDVGNDQLETVKGITATEAAKTPPFKLQIAETGMFPAGRGGKTLWIGVQDPSEEMSRLAGRLDSELGKFGFPVEHRRFAPHLTIARIREARGLEAAISKHRNAKFDPVEFTVSEAVIYRSELHPSVPVYTPIATFPFSV